MTKRVKVTVDRRGKATVELEGFRGEACLVTLAKVLKALGLATSTTPTSEYYQTSTDVRTYEYE